MDSDFAGRGLASAAVQRVVEMARDEVGLHGRRARGTQDTRVFKHHINDALSCSYLGRV
nr:hypothetical protein [Arthrobacter sp. efr-133-R2A-120]